MSSFFFRTRLLLLLPLILVNPVSAQTTEMQLKAAFLYRFSQFAEWPAVVYSEKNDKFILCTDDTSDFFQALEIIQGKPVNHGEMQIRKISSSREMNGCHMLYIQTSDSKQLATYLEQGSKYQVLTVSDVNGFAAAGGMIELIKVDNRIHFEINQYAATQAGIKFSAQLLKLAKVVYTNGQ